MKAKPWFQSRGVRLQLGLATGLLCYFITWHNPVCYKTLYSTAQQHFQLFKKTMGNGTDS